MNDVQIFNNPEFGDIRTLTVNGEPWFCGRDVAIALGYKKPETSIRDRVREKDTEKFGTPTSGGTQDFLYINESGLYRLIFGSRLESAERFQDWVFDEVLPSIRKTGSYTAQLPTTTAGQIQLLAKGHVELEKKIEAVKEDMQETKNDFEEFKQNCPCFPVELSAITDEVKRKGVSVMGGKSSNAYHDRSITTKVYQDIYSEIHRNFGCNTYKAIPRKHVPKVLELIQGYTLPIILQEKVTQANK